MDAGSHADGAAPAPIPDRGVTSRQSEGVGARMARLKGQAKRKVMGTLGMVRLPTAYHVKHHYDGRTSRQWLKGSSCEPNSERQLIAFDWHSVSGFGRWAGA